MPNTYVALKTNTVTGSAVASVVFDLTGISGYTDLVLVATGTATALTNLSLRFNGDTTSNYSRTMLYGNGSTATSYRVANYSGIPLGDFDTSQIATHIVNIQNYNNATTFKTVLARWNNNAGTYASLGATASLWRKTPEAITSITIYADSGNLNVGSTFSLYGIANADQGTAKATGGMITEDSTYWYHTFAASGTFTPKQSLSCDYLVVAGGGGGGGYYHGAGGGAGGLRAITTQALTNGTNYAVTVGAGGAGGVVNGGAGTNGVASSFNSFATSGGGGGGSTNGSLVGSTGKAGGSGGGAPSYNSSLFGAGNAGSYSPVEGYAGGTAGSSGAPYYGAGGGGGAAAVGSNGSSSAGGAGGAGTDTYNSINFSSWLTATNTGSSSKLAGGGGGSAYDVGSFGAGGVGGGGRGANQVGSTNNPVAGTANTGGGGGGSERSGAGVGAAGGSGLVIVRYLKA